MLVLFVAYQSSIIAFSHVHYINGVLITHSHPFKGEHSHTKSEVLVIDRLSHFTLPEATLQENLHPLRPLLRVVCTEPLAVHPQLRTVRVLSLRAPPVA